MYPKRIEAGATWLAVDSAGSGPTLVLSHGMLCSRRMFDRILPSLARDWRVVRFDFSGHGQSGPPPDRFDLDRLADEFQWVIDDTGESAVHALGFSMGGMALLRLALRHPDRLRSLALLNTTAEAQPFHERQLLRILAALTRTGRFGRRPADLATRFMFSPSFRRERPDIALAWRHGVEAMSATAKAKTTRLIAGRDSVRNHLPDIHLPALVIGSNRDQAVPVEHARILAAELPETTLCVLSGVGHATPLEAPDDVLRILRPFLRGVHARPFPASPGSGNRVKYGLEFRSPETPPPDEA